MHTQTLCASVQRYVQPETASACPPTHHHQPALASHRLPTNQPAPSRTKLLPYSPPARQHTHAPTCPPNQQDQLATLKNTHTHIHTHALWHQSLVETTPTAGEGCRKDANKRQTHTHTHIQVELWMTCVQRSQCMCVVLVHHQFGALPTRMFDVVCSARRCDATCCDVWRCPCARACFRPTCAWNPDNGGLQLVVSSSPGVVWADVCCCQGIVATSPALSMKLGRTFVPCVNPSDNCCRACKPTPRRTSLQK